MIRCINYLERPTSGKVIIDGQDLELKSVKKKYKSKGFAAGCSREVIERGAQMLGWELDRLIEQTIIAMRSCEDEYSKIG